MNNLIDMHAFANAVVYSLLGVIIFALGFWIGDKLTPKTDFWKQLVEEKNVAFAIVLAGASIGICNIIASAIR